MDNDTIIEIICQLENINLNDWYPMAEDGEKSDKEFDKRFLLDRTYQWEWINFVRRIRFVKYPNNQYIILNIITMRISQVLRDQLNGGRAVYHLNKSINIPINRLELPFKLKKIMKKMGR